MTKSIKAVIAGMDRAILLLNAQAVALSLAFMTVVVIALVLGRNLFGLAFFWGEELARYAMIYMAFLGGAVAIRADQNPKLTVFTSMFPEVLRRYLSRVIALLMAVTLIVLFFQGLDIALNEGRMKTPALRINFFWVFLAVPIGAAAMLIQLILSQFFVSPLTVSEDEDVPEVTE